MQTLVIILIIVLIVHSGIFIYSKFIDINRNKETTISLSIMEAATKQYANNVESLQNAIKNRDENIELWRKEYNEVVKSYNTVVKYLPNYTQKLAMKHIIEGKIDEYPDCIDILKDYYDLVSKVKYKDENNETS